MAACLPSRVGEGEWLRAPSLTPHQDFLANKFASKSVLSLKGRGRISENWRSLRCAHSLFEHFWCETIFQSSHKSHSLLLKPDSVKFTILTHPYGVAPLHHDIAKFTQFSLLRAGVLPPLQLSKNGCKPCHSCWPVGQEKSAMNPFH